MTAAFIFRTTFDGERRRILFLKKSDQEAQLKKEHYIKILF